MIKKTYLITRKLAIEAIMKDLEKYDDEEVAEILESFFDNIRSYRVVTEAEIELNSCKDWPERVVKSINEF